MLQVAMGFSVLMLMLKKKIKIQICCWLSWFFMKLLFFPVMMNG